MIISSRRSDRQKYTCIAGAMLWSMAALSAGAEEVGRSTAYQQLDITSSTRIYGLGGVNITTIDIDDINSADQNPALLGPEYGTQIGVNYMRWLGESNFAGIRAGGGAGEHSGWSAALQYFGYGSIRQTEADGTISGSYSPSDITFSGSYSHDLTNLLRVGIALKMAYSNYADYTALALATDIGLNYYDPESDLSVSVVASNLGGQIKRFADSYDHLPADVRIGVSKSFAGIPVRWSVTAWNLTKWHLPYYDNGDGSATDTPKLKDKFVSNLMRHIVFGVDIIASDRINVSLGYNYKTRTDMSTYSRSFLSGITIGAGLKINAFGIGIAMAQPHSGATTLMVNISTNIYDLTH